jgi:hypothetical protein
LGGGYIHMKIVLALLLALVLASVLIGCAGKKTELTTVSPAPAATVQPTVNTGAMAVIPSTSNNNIATISVKYSRDDLDSSISNANMSYIKLEGARITLSGSGATVNGNKVTITAAGAYSLSGKLDDGQIIVNTEDQETVKLVLNGANISCSNSAPIYVIKAEKTVITLAGGSNNTLTDGKEYVLENSEVQEPNAAVFSKSDLTINGSGSLTVQANYNNGIQSKDDLKIVSGQINVTSINDGIKGKDSIAVKDGNITVKAGGDGLQSENSEDPTKGYILVEGGTLNITCGTDGFQAETSLIISNGNITITSGGGSFNSSTNIGTPGNTWGNWNPSITSSYTDSSVSAKGLKAGVNVTVNGGTINIDSSDDAVHSNDSITLNGGKLTLSSGDDGLHADTVLEIKGGQIDLQNSYEGMESAAITIEGGSLHLVSSDDGINVVGGNDGSALNGRPGQNTFGSSASNHLDIRAGYVYIDANGDGIDVNGPITMSGGTVIVNGPTRNDNGALDHAGFTVTGGYLLAVGSSGMAQASDVSSTQYAVMINLTTSLAAGTMVHIENPDGQSVLTFVPTKTYQSVVLCSSELKNGSTYIVYTGGGSTGTATEGLYSGGTYTEGTKINTFTISSMVTTIGTMGGFPGGGFRPGVKP